jgi:hypothetical protein
MSTYKTVINEMYFNGWETSPDADTFRVPENFDRYNKGSGWEAYHGGNDWENGSTGVAVYLNPEGYNKEMARIWFEIKFPDNISEYVDTSHGYKTPQGAAVQKWGNRAAVRWLTTTDRIRKSTKKLHGAHDGYDHEWVERKPWRECFVLALESERMKPFVKRFGIDKTKWVGMKRETPEQNKHWAMDDSATLTPSPAPATNGVAVNLKGHLLEVSYKEPSLTLEQWQVLKDLAIECGAGKIKDSTGRRIIKIDENRLLFENFHENKEWFVYEGAHTITAVFEDNSRQTFKVHYRKNRMHDDRDSHKQKAARTWKKLAMEVRKSAGISKAGNPIVIPWQECFQQALGKPEMLEYIDDLRSSPIFECIGFSPRQPLSEMTYDDLLRSTDQYRSKADISNGTKTGSDSRIRGSKEVNAKSLRVISTVGKDGNEHETSTFSYKTRNPSGDPRKSHTRWQGFMRFLGKENNRSPVMPTKDEQDMEVNCTCPDYKYVFANANAKSGAGVTGRQGSANVSSVGSGGGEKPVNIFEASFNMGNDNDGTNGRGIRNPRQTPGLCKHLIALGKYLNDKTSQVAPEQPNDKEEPVAQAGEEPPKAEPVAPVKPEKPKKPVNIFETMKQFALSNPQFDVPYED